MNPIDPQQLWNDAVQEIPLESNPESQWDAVRSAIRGRRRRRVIRVASFAGVVVIGALLFWSARGSFQVEIVQGPESPARNTVPVRDAELSVPMISESRPPQAVGSPADSTSLVVQEVPLKDFLKQLPHHGYMTVRNERGRFLVIVDNLTGESITKRIAEDLEL